jgi:PAS domain S-box-containing protein
MVRTSPWRMVTLSALRMWRGSRSRAVTFPPGRTRSASQLVISAGAGPDVEASSAGGDAGAGEDVRGVLVEDVGEPFVQLMGYRSASQIIGLRDEDISPEYLVDHYRSNDERVLTTGERIVDMIELVRNVDGTYDWFLTMKQPIRAPGGTILGLVGVTRGLTKRNALVERLLPLTPAVSLIVSGYHRQLSVRELADSVAMSTSQFSRLFKRHFGATPHRYLLRVRLMAACDLLATTDLALSVVACRTGYYDQSHLSNDLVRERGITPSAYRARVRQAAR